MADGFKMHAVKGMTLMGAERLATHVLRFVVSLVMARLLAPSDYGTVGMLAIFMAIATTFQDSGFSSALIQKKDVNGDDYSTAFYFGMAVSIGFYAAFFFSAPAIASFYKTPELVQITRTITLGLVINALSSVHQTHLTVNLKFGALATVSVVSLVVSSIIGIVLAYMGYGAWALVWQSVLGSAFNTVILWCVARWRPQLRFSLLSFKKLFGFGSKLLCSGMINTIYGNLYTLVIGRMFGAAEIGHFNRANGFAALPTDSVSGVVLRVNYPILSKFQDDTSRLIGAYRKLTRCVMFILVPSLFGMAAVAEPMVRVLIGEKWLPCVPLLQVLCIGMMWSPLTQINLNLLYVKGRTDLVLKLELIKKPIAFAILFLMIPFGIFWMCVGKAVYDFIAFCFNCHYTKKILGYGFVAQMADIVPLVLNASVMACLAWFSARLADSSAAKLPIGIAVGVAAYALGALAYREEALKSLVDILPSRRHSN